MTIFWIWLIGVPITGLLIILNLGPENFQNKVTFGEFLTQLLVVLIWGLAWPMVWLGFLWNVYLGIKHYHA